MKRIITAVGNEELNNILKERNEYIVESPDIQYQEGIIEALDKYKNIDIAIINEDIIGNLDLEDLIRSIIILKNDIQIILVTERENSILETKNIAKVINNKINYVKEILDYLSSKTNIKQEKVTKIKSDNETKTKQRREEKYANEKQITKEELKIKEKSIITVIGSSGIRQNNIFIHICKTFKN